MWDLNDGVRAMGVQPMKIQTRWGSERGGGSKRRGLIDEGRGEAWGSERCGSDAMGVPTDEGASAMGYDGGPWQRGGGEVDGRDESGGVGIDWDGQKGGGGQDRPGGQDLISISSQPAMRGRRAGGCSMGREGQGTAASGGQGSGRQVGLSASSPARWLRSSAIELVNAVVAGGLDAVLTLRWWMLSVSPCLRQSRWQSVMRLQCRSRGFAGVAVVGRRAFGRTGSVPAHTLRQQGTTLSNSCYTRIPKSEHTKSLFQTKSEHNFETKPTCVVSSPAVRAVVVRTLVYLALAHP